ncbi:hypothetical protein FWH09_00150 [Candidatus Saccharibacteria bacterium]|nr:hypothetical protein [Candidatus Saccharibacteria bacterium]
MKALQDCKKITVLGIPGSGKTHLSTILGEKLDLPVFHMDMKFRGITGHGKLEDRIPIILEGIKKEVEKPKWIIDGNYPSHLEVLRMRLEKADLVLYLNLPFDFCIENIRNRGYQNIEAKNGLDTPESVEELVMQIKTKYGQANENIKQHIQKYANNKHIEFNSRDEVDKFILLTKSHAPRPLPSQPPPHETHPEH